MKSNHSTPTPSAKPLANVTINNTDLPLAEYNGQRVITFQMIDTVHERATGTASRNFRENRTRFIEGVDFIEPTSDEIRRMSEQGIFPPRSARGVLITESGYLMLVKSLTDDLSWSVQRQLVQAYFRADLPPPLPMPQLMSEIGTVFVFRFEDRVDVRVVLRFDAAVWFAIPDVCHGINLNNPSMAAQRLDDDERAMGQFDYHSPAINIASESGVFSLLISSRKEEAQRFKQWLTSEVLPAIRRQCHYMQGGALSPDKVFKLLQLERQLTLDVAKSKDSFSRKKLLALLAEVSLARGTAMPSEQELPTLPAQLKMEGV